MGWPVQVHFVKLYDIMTSHNSVTSLNFDMFGQEYWQWRHDAGGTPTPIFHPKDCLFFGSSLVRLSLAVPLIDGRDTQFVVL